MASSVLMLRVALAISSFLNIQMGTAGTFLADVVGGAVEYNKLISPDTQSAALAGEAGSALYSESALAGTPSTRFLPAFGPSAAYGAGSGNGDRVTIFADVDNVEPLMIEAEDTRSISSVDPDNTASTVAFTVTDTATMQRTGRSFRLTMHSVEPSELTLTLVTA